MHGRLIHTFFVLGLTMFPPKTVAFPVSPLLSRSFRETLLSGTQQSRETSTLQTQSELCPLEGAEILKFELQTHRPLGCTVEESLATTIDNKRFVFISKVKEDGNAERAGLRVGDVIIQINGLFGEMEDVSGLGLNKVKGCVAARPDDEPLTVIVARGTRVLDDHEEKLVDLCSNPTLDSKETDECITSFLRDGYYVDDTPLGDEASDAALSENGLQGGDILNDVFSIWADDVKVLTPEKQPGKNQEAMVEKPIAKPWSSRSSPSGTYVRDPRTGKVTNIDA